MASEMIGLYNTLCQYKVLGKFHCGHQAQLYCFPQTFLAKELFVLNQYPSLTDKHLRKHIYFVGSLGGWGIKIVCGTLYMLALGACLLCMHLNNTVLCFPISWYLNLNQDNKGHQFDNLWSNFEMNFSLIQINTDTDCY